MLELRHEIILRKNRTTNLWRTRELLFHSNYEAGGRDASDVLGLHLRQERERERVSEYECENKVQNKCCKDISFEPIIRIQDVTLG